MLYAAGWSIRTMNISIGLSIMPIPGVFKESGAVAGLLDALPVCLAIVAAIWCASMVLTPIAEWLARWVCATGEMIARRGKSLMGRLTSFS